MILEPKPNISNNYVELRVEIGPHTTEVERMDLRTCVKTLVAILTNETFL